MVRRSRSLDSADQPRNSRAIFAFLFKFLLFPVSLFIKLAADDRRLARTNSKYLAKAQHQKPTTRRRLTKAASLLLVFIQIGSLVCLSMGVATTGRGPEFFIKRIAYNGLDYIGRWSDLFNPIWVYAFLLTSVGAAFLKINLFRFNFFGLSEAKHSRMTKALQQANLDKPEGEPEPWFYEDRMLDITMVGSNASDLKDRKSFWRESGFNPSPNSIDVEGANRNIFIAGAKKKSNSTLLIDRYEEWNNFIDDPNTDRCWWLGEYVEEGGYHLRNCYSDFSSAFIGASGSGKTEGMKTWLTAYLLKHPDTRLVICDPKALTNWDVFAPLTEFGMIHKSVDDALKAINACRAIMETRKKYLSQNGYSDIREWERKEGVSVPPVLLVIDEWPQLAGALRFEIQKDREASPANTLFKLMTVARAYGVWVCIGSQFGTSEYIPSAINKNTKVHAIFRVGSPGESSNWLQNDAAFYIGKRKRKPDGQGFLGEQGYGYIDGPKEHVRFWYMPDWVILHELVKRGVPPAKGFSRGKLEAPKSADDTLAQKIEDKGLQSLTRAEKAAHLKFMKKIAPFRERIESFNKTPPPLAAEPKEPMVPLYREDEDHNEYLLRLYEHIGIEPPKELASSKGSGSAGSPFGGPRFGQDPFIDRPPRGRPPRDRPLTSLSDPADDDNFLEEIVFETGDAAETEQDDELARDDGTVDDSDELARDDAADDGDERGFADLDDLDVDLEEFNLDEKPEQPLALEADVRFDEMLDARLAEKRGKENL